MPYRSHCTVHENSSSQASPNPLGNGVGEVYRFRTRAQTGPVSRCGPIAATTTAHTPRLSATNLSVVDRFGRINTKAACNDTFGNYGDRGTRVTHAGKDRRRCRRSRDARRHDISSYSQKNHTSVAGNTKFIGVQKPCSTLFPLPCQLASHERRPRDLEPSAPRHS